MIVNGGKVFEKLPKKKIYIFKLRLLNSKRKATEH